MKRSNLNLPIDILAFIGLILLLGSGLLVRYILPPGSGENLSVWALTRHEWGEIHFWIAAFLTTVITVHLVLHWRWIVSVIQNKPREGSGMRVALGSIGFIVLLIIAVAPFLTPREQLTPSATGGKETRTFPDKSKASEEQESIRGSMTLEDVKRSTGVPVKYLLKRLDLPENTSPGQKLGQLSKKYGLRIEDVRKVVMLYQE
ncbi:MAG: DUF4405 domain-containing protein [Nitrospinae bacterium]|nr:DUF4405 domain-containing protein [Nitrospinota bacterium]MBL7021053.1 DUF4405 domain-containing protein [Nitrospinaceae bacterium]